MQKSGWIDGRRWICENVPIWRSDGRRRISGSGATIQRMTFALRRGVYVLFLCWFVVYGDDEPMVEGHV